MQAKAPWYAPPTANKIKTIAVIGAGLAGTSLAYALTQKNLKVLLIDQAEMPPTGASRNQVALIKPQLSPDHNLPDQYFTEAFLHFSDFIKNYPELILSQGILELAHSKKMQIRHQGIMQKRDLSHLVHYVNAKQASELAGITLEHTGLYFHNAFLLDVPLYYQTLQKLCGDHLQIFNAKKVKALTYQDEQWLLEADTPIAANAVIFAQGYQGFGEYLDRDTLIPCPGQLSFIQPKTTIPLKCTLTFEGYLTPALHGQHILGASFRHNEDTEIHAYDHQKNLEYLSKITPDVVTTLRAAPSHSWCAMRITSKDHLPLIGGVPIKAIWLKDYERIKFGDFRARQYPNCAYYPNLYMSLAHGSKGVISSFYAGQILANLIDNQNIITSPKAWQAIHPARFWLRSLRTNDSNGH